MAEQPRGYTVKDAPDYHALVVPVVFPSGSEIVGVYYIQGTQDKYAEPLVTTYLKQGCILPESLVISNPTGTVLTYEGGYTCRALIYKNGTGEKALAKAVLDAYVLLQNADGSWYQGYYPVQNAAGSHDVTSEIKVDSGAALLAWAMAYYDSTVGPASEIYKAAVQKAMSFLRECQYQHTLVYGTNLLANAWYPDGWNTTALLADCAECLLAMEAALDQYGAALTTSEGYSVKTMANDLFYSMVLSGWTGTEGRYFQTEYPFAGYVAGLTILKQKITFTQGLCAYAVKRWSDSAHNTVGDYSSESQICLDLICALSQGKWGGFYYSPYTGETDETIDEYTAYAAHAVIGMIATDSTRYERNIARGQNFIRLAAFKDGSIFNVVRMNGRLDVDATASAGFLSLNVALGLLAGA